MERRVAEYLAAAPIMVRELNGRITYWSDGAQELYGYRWEEAVGRVSHELLKTVFPMPIADIECRLSSDGHWEGLLQHTRKDGGALWTQSNWRLKAVGTVVEMNVDVTDREILAREVQHRAKNTIAVIQGLARMSFQQLRQAEEVKAFQQRLVAVGRAHDNLIRRYWEYGELQEVVAGVVALLGLNERVRAAGPSIRLRPSSVLAYTLAIHELAANALKHGALSKADGYVDVSWRTVGESGERICIVWQERGGPPVTPPTHAGFGRSLLEDMLARELGAPVELRFEPEGLVCEIDGTVQKRSDLGQAG